MVKACLARTNNFDNKIYKTLLFDYRHIFMWKMRRVFGCVVYKAMLRYFKSDAKTLVFYAFGIVILKIYILANNNRQIEWAAN